MIELNGTSGSEHLSSGSEHHACRASVIYSEHQGTSTQMVVTGFESHCRDHQNTSSWNEVDNVILDRAYLPLCPR